MKTICLLGISVFLIGPLLTGCGKDAPQAAPPPPVVSVVQPIAREVIEWDEYIGRLESPETVEIRARVSGYLDKVHFKEGKEVKKGDLLFTIDPRPYQAEFDRADAEYQRAQSQAELAKNDAERAKRLIATKAISEEDFDTKAKTYASALAAVRSARAAIDSQPNSISNSPKSARRLTGGSAARWSRREIWSAAGCGRGRDLLTTLVSQDPLYCYVDADERSILKYLRLRREGKRESARDSEIPAEMELADETGFPHKGYIDFVDNKR